MKDYKHMNKDIWNIHNSKELIKAAGQLCSSRQAFIQTPRTKHKSDNKCLYCPKNIAPAPHGNSKKCRQGDNICT